jgi:4-amino-4-deoxy-L-arabinose transferase-like glycosyltransferase
MADGQTKGVWQMTAVPLAVGAGCRLLAVAYAQVLHGNFLFLDDQGYDRIGWSLAQAWHMNTFPSPGSIAYAGTVSYLYYVVVAAVYFVFGHHWILVKLIGALLSALSVPTAAVVGDSLGGRRLAWSAAWLAALYPNAIFWGATGLKDGPSATLLLAVAAIAFRPPAIRRVVGAGVLIAGAFLFRPVLGISGLVMLLAPAIDWVRRRRREFPLRGGARLPVLLVGLPLLLVVSGFLAARYLPSLDGNTASAAGAASAPPISMSYSLSPYVFLRGLLGPYPWSFGSTADSVYRALYPGMVVWILMLPAVVLGCWEILRREPWAARGLVISALAFLYLYATVFQDQGFFRQRFTVEVPLLIVGLYAFDRYTHRAAVWTAAGACVVAPAALVQARVISLADLVLVAAALGSLWFASRVAGAGGRRITRWRRRERRALIGTHASGGRRG